MESKPLVSVLMTSFNREQFISEAIESVLKSTYPNFELIIVDDRSKDKTVAIAKSFAEKDSRVKVFINEKNLGDYANRNMAASYATGEWIMSVDSDDKMNSDGIEKVLNCMQQFPLAHFGMYHYLGTELKEIQSSAAIRRHLLEKRFLAIGPGGTIIRRKYFETIKGYPEKYGPANDMYFNLKATSQSSIVMFPFEFHFYRRHEGQEINNYFSYIYNNYCYMRDALLELNLFLTEKEKKWLSNKNNRRFLYNISKYFFNTRDFGKVKEAFNKTRFGFKEALSGIFHLS